MEVKASEAKYGCHILENCPSEIALFQIQTPSGLRTGLDSIAVSVFLVILLEFD